MGEYEEIIKEWRSKPLPTSVKGWYPRLGRWLYEYLANDMQLGGKDVSTNNVKTVYEQGMLHNFTGHINTVGELKNNEELMQFFIRSLVSGEPFSEKVVKRFNKSLTNGILDVQKYNNNGERPGEYRRKNYTFGLSRVGTEPEFIQMKMNDLMMFMKSAQTTPMRVIAVAHCMFENIHPFAQSNGRTGRLMFNYYLISNGYPPLVIFKEDKEEYISALRAFDDNQENVRPMFELLKNSMVKTWSQATPKSAADILKTLDEENIDGYFPENQEI